MNKLAQVLGWGLIVFIGISFAVGTALAVYESLTTADSISETREPVSAHRRAYMDGCNPDGLQEEYCRCTFDYLLDDVGISGIEDLGYEYEETGRIPHKLQEAANYCVENHGRTI